MKSNRKEIVPLLISVLLVLVSIGIVFTTDYVLNKKHYIGFGALILSSFVYFKNKVIYRNVFVFTLVAGLLGLLDFFYTTFKIGFGIIQINPLFLLLLILFFAFDNYKQSSNPSNENKVNLKMVQVYKEKYRTKSEEELSVISNRKSKYVNEAKIASKQILEEKYKMG